jgi:cytochrome oxidase Cu insertion factor (SCO1/SenC/PrrC family)
VSAYLRRVPHTGRMGWLWAALAGALLALALFGAGEAMKLNRSSPTPVPQTAAGWGYRLDGEAAPNFTLVDQFGRTRSLASFHGKEVVLAFVDTECTSVCPLTAQILRTAKAQLSTPEASQVRIVGINANPLVNGVKATRKWSVQHGMLHQWLFLTGTRRQLRSVYRNFRIYDAVTGDGRVQHDSAVIVLDPTGRERLYFDTSNAKDRPTVQSEETAYATGMRQWLRGGKAPAS